MVPIFQQIINLEDFFVDSNSSTLYIVMELMECDLKRVLASGQILTAKHVKVLLKQLLLGVQAMHRQGFLRESTDSIKVDDMFFRSLCDP